VLREGFESQSVTARGGVAEIFTRKLSVTESLRKKNEPEAYASGDYIFV
jgi:hypothetical protein